MNDAVSNAIAAASLAANSQAPAVVPQQGTAMAPVTPGKRRSLADAVSTAGTSCDFYLQASDKSGMTIDKDDSEYLASLNVEINFSELSFPYCLKWNAAGQTQYARSYDGVVDARTGGPWANTIQQARLVDQKCSGQYDAVEFVGTLLEEVKLKSGKVFPAGTRVGHTTSTTGTKHVMSWIVAVTKELGETPVVKVTLNHKRIEKGTNKWGVIVPETITTN